MNEDSVILVYICNKHVLYESEGDLVCICINTMAVVLEKSGLTTCSVLVTSIHWQNVHTTAGVFITVVTMKTCPSSVVMVSASPHHQCNTSYQCHSFFIAHKLFVFPPPKKLTQLENIQLQNMHEPILTETTILRPRGSNLIHKFLAQMLAYIYKRRVTEVNCDS